MIIESLGQEAQTNLKNKSATFSVSTEKAKKFLHIAVRNLYTNPILASVVETSQNAYDEHVRKGIGSKPFEVTLPTTWNPIFSVRDFGGGIPHDYMLDGYTKALESTKDSDAEMSGGWGLGRLALLSLSSTYNVTTYIDGVERNYSVFESENGIEIILTVQKKTTEPNGTLISAPVNYNKAYDFIQACRTAFRFYKVKPIFKGQTVEIEEVKYNLRGDGWGVTTAEYNTNYAVCGIYNYKLEPSNISGLKQNHINILNRGGLVLFFGASELSPMANRQGIYYNEKTVEAIKKRLDDVEEAYCKEIQKKIDSCTSIFEAKKTWYKMFYSQKDSLDYNMVRGKEFSWNGYKVKDNTFEDWKKIGASTSVDTFIPIKIERFFAEYKRSNYVARKEDSFKQIEIKEKTRFFVNDLYPKGYSRRVNSLVREEPGVNAYVFTFKDEAQKKIFFKETGLQDCDFENVSKLEVIMVNGGADRTRAKSKVFQWNGGHETRISYMGDNWSHDVEIDFEENDENIYVGIERFQPVGSKITPYNFWQALSLLQSGGHIDKNFALYGIRANSKEMEIAKDSDNWIHFDDFIDNFLKTYKIDDEELEQLANEQEYSDNLTNVTLGYLVRWNYLAKNKIEGFKNKFFKDYLEKIFELKEAEDFITKNKVKEKHSCFVFFGGSIKKSTPKYSLKKLQEELFKACPILKYVNINDVKNLMDFDSEFHNLLEQKKLDS